MHPIRVINSCPLCYVLLRGGRTTTTTHCSPLCLCSIVCLPTDPTPLCYLAPHSYMHPVCPCTVSDLRPTLCRTWASLIFWSWLSKASIRALQVNKLLEASRACSRWEQAASSLLAPSLILTSLSICFCTSSSCQGLQKNRNIHRMEGFGLYRDREGKG